MSKYKRYERYKDSGIEWIGEIPEEWEIKKIKRCLRVRNGEEIDTEIEVDRGTEINVYGSGGVFKKTTKYLFKGESVLFGRKGTIGKPMYVNEAFWTVDTMYYTEFKEDVNPKWFYYMFLIYPWEAFTTQTALPSIVGTEIENDMCAIPNYKEQIDVANFLDQKTAEVDGLIADKEKLIELLQEKRQAIISEAVTKGINKDVRYKDSGIEWIGKIPEHWKTIKMKYLVKTVQTGTTPSTKNDEYFNGEIQWFTPGDFIGNKELYESNRKISRRAIEDNESRLFHKETVMIVGIGATIGKVAKLGVDGSFNQQITGIVVDEQYLNCDYLYYCLCINQETIKNTSNYTTLPIINNEFIKNLECVSPSVTEQKEIVKYLNEKIAEIDGLVNEIKIQIQSLEEYRQSLITEVVTGKIDVRDYVTN